MLKCNDFAKVFSFESGQLLLWAEYDGDETKLHRQVVVDEFGGVDSCLTFSGEKKAFEILKEITDDKAKEIFEFVVKLISDIVSEDKSKESV